MRKYNDLWVVDQILASHTYVGLMCTIALCCWTRHFTLLSALIGSRLILYTVDIKDPVVLFLAQKYCLHVS